MGYSIEAMAILLSYSCISGGGGGGLGEGRRGGGRETRRGEGKKRKRGRIVVGLLAYQGKDKDLKSRGLA